MKTKYKIHTFIVVCCFLLQSILSLGQNTKSEMDNVVPEIYKDQLTQIPPGDIQINGEIGRRINVTIYNNIRQLNIEKNFTNPFEAKTGPNVGEAFIGMGMLIDATVRLAAYSGDKELIVLKNKIVDNILEEQLDDGYIGLFQPDERLWASKGYNWDIHEMAFIIDGLLSDYQFFDNHRALEAAIKTADYIISRWKNMPDDYDAVVDMHVLDTGIDWAILRLYKLTDEQRFLNFSENIKSLYKWNTPITIGRRPGVSGHMFAYLAMCMAQIELFRLTEKNELLNQTENAINFLLKDDGVTITGSAGIREIWTSDQDGEGQLGETCATAYQLRIYESLLRLTGDSMYGDLIERTVFNGLFAAQSPDGNKIRYYTPFEGEREYYEAENMCCPGNYRRIISELPGMVFYKTMENGIAVNLYTPSSSDIKIDNDITLRVEQKTDYPSSGKIELLLSPEKSAVFHILLRIPAWTQDATIDVNGKTVQSEIKPGSFLEIKRTWTEGDKITLNFPMKFRFIKGRKRNAGRVALMHGPIIYSLNLDNNPNATANGKLTYNDLRRILIDPTTINKVFDDDSVRPDGTAVYISGWREDYSGMTDRKHEFRLKLTEFPDPGSQFIYFKIPDYNIEVDDELVRKENISIP